MPVTQTRSTGNLSGPQKSAVLCIALGPEGAARILRQLSPDDVERVTREIAAMPAIDPDQVQAVLDEFHQASSGESRVMRGGAGFARQVLEQAVGAARAQTMAVQLDPRLDDRGFARLRRSAPAVIAGMLRDEHPQTIAVALAQVDPARAAATLACLDHATGAEVLYRAARTERIAPEALALVEAALGGPSAAPMAADPAPLGGPDLAAEWIRQGGEALEKPLLEALEQRSADTADAIRRRLFTFEDLLKVDNKGMQRVLRDVEGRELALALKAASDDLKKHIKTNMSERAGAALDEEIEILGSVRVRDVEAAHASIVEKVRALEQSGEIMVRGRGGASDVID